MCMIIYINVTTVIATINQEKVKEGKRSYFEQKYIVINTCVTVIANVSFILLVAWTHKSFST